GRHRAAPRGDRGVLPGAPRRGGALPPLVGAEGARAHLRHLYGARGARRWRGRVPARAWRARGREAPERAIRPENSRYVAAAARRRSMAARRPKEQEKPAATMGDQGG